MIQPLPGIGDMVWHLPHLHAIAAASPDGRVSVLAKPRSRADVLLRADPSVHEVIWVARRPGTHDGVLGWFRLADRLRGFGFQRVFVLHHSVRYIAAAWFAGIPERVSYGIGWQRWFQTSPLALPEDVDRHPIGRADHLLRLHGIPRNEPEPMLPIDEGLAAQAAHMLPGSDRPWLAVGIGASEPYKRWEREKFAECIRRLRQRHAFAVLLVGGDPDKLTAEWLIGQQGRDAEIYDATGLPVDVTAALLSRCTLYLGNDTGFLNIAAAVGTPAIGLFGGSPPLYHSRRIHPLLPEGRAARYGDPYMARISVDAVLAEVERVLERARPS